jgi:uncharacterized membrane protein YcaP (DUF421 family)
MVPDPSIEQPTEAIIKVTSSGICGADIQKEARQAQITSVDDIQWASLENDGKISCVPRHE